MIEFMRVRILRSFVCLFVLTSLMVAPCLSSQVDSFVKRKTSLFGKGRLLRADGIKIYFSGINLADTIFVYQPKGSNENRSVLPSEVIRIEVVTGSYVWEGALLGGAIGFAISLLSYENYKSNIKEKLGSETYWKSSDTARTAGTIVVFGLLGALEGSRHKIYARVYPQKGSFP